MAYLRVQLSFGLFSCCFLIMLYFNGWEMLTRLKDMRMKQVQEKRRQTIAEMCQSDNKTFSEHTPLSQLLVDDTHGIIYCYIPKAACGTLKKFMVVLQKGEPYIDPIIMPRTAHRLVTPLGLNPSAEIKAKLKHYTKFLFVRDPFVRLVSAYRNKFEKYNAKFYERFGPNILRYSGAHPNPPNTLDKALASGIHITFHNFIKYLLDPRTEKTRPFDKHWKQMYRLCQPCHIQYDFIGHQESLKEDIEHLLRILMVPDDIRFIDPRVNMTTRDSLVDWFTPLSPKDRRKLYEVYEADFKLFGYSRPDELFQG